MGRKKKNEIVDIVDPEEYKQIVDEYDKELQTNPKYSLVVDPENKYNMSDMQRHFVETYVEVKSLPLTADMLGTDMTTVMTFFNMYSSKKEIERLTMAQLHRRIRSKMWDYDQIGGYLTTLLTEENVPLAERLNSKDKLGVVRMLIDLNDRKAQMLQKPIEAESIDLDTQLKELSVDTIKNLLEQDDLNGQKKEIVNRIKKNVDVSIEEEQLLKTMTLPELLKMLEDTGG